MTSQYTISIQRVMKRAFDLIVATILLVLLGPLFVTLCILIFLQMGRPIFFFQVRPGKDEKLFSIVKFRTMIAQPKDRYLEDFERFTRLGLIVRNLSLDEIPQLFNVIKGDLSLVGPRPLLVEYLPLYNERQRMRHKVPPGITGWAQINGRNSISWEEKFEYDIWYVENWSFWLDIKILFLTFSKVVKRDGINSSADMTMKKFTGSP